jgi:hypothetical protein
MNFRVGMNSAEVSMVAFIPKNKERWIKQYNTVNLFLSHDLKTKVEKL